LIPPRALVVASFNEIVLVPEVVIAFPVSVTLIPVPELKVTLVTVPVLDVLPLAKL
jgi:hypothetical protein